MCQHHQILDAFCNPGKPFKSRVATVVSFESRLTFIIQKKVAFDSNEGRRRAGIALDSTAKDDQGHQRTIDTQDQVRQVIEVLRQC